MSQGPFGAAGGAAPAHPLDELWYVQGEAAPEGPYKGHVLKEMIKARVLGAASFVAPVGATQWTALVNVPAFASGLPPPAVVRYAGFWIRLLAYLLDMLLLIVLFAVAGAIAVAIAFAVGMIAAAAGTSDATTASAQIMKSVPLIVVLGCALFYYVYFPSGAWQATPGKRICGLRIIRTDGSRVTSGLALGRWASCFLSAKLLGIGFLMIGWNREKKGLHDILCGTRVVYAKR
jgi:uncharacterized RDD family membrane protein YckC